MTTYSNSRLSCYENCPRQFKFKYIDEVDPPDPFESIEQFLGLRSHEALEYLYHQTIYSSTPSLEECLSFYEDRWNTKFHSGVRIIKKGLNSQDFKKTGRKALACYYQQNEPFDSSKTLGTEMRINFSIGTYPFVGFIDRLGLREDGIYEIHDYKTSSRFPSREALAKDRQLALYQIGLIENYQQVAETELIWHYLIFGKDLCIKKTPEELKIIKENTLNLIHLIEDDQRFEPKESALCSWCEYVQICPSKKHASKVRTLPAKAVFEDEGVYLVYRYQLLLEKLRKQEEEVEKVRTELQFLQEEIEEYADKHSLNALQGAQAQLKIQKRKCIRFPKINQEDQDKLHLWLSEQKAWKELSSIDIQKIRQYLLSEKGVADIKKKLLEYAETYESSDIVLEKISDDGVAGI